MENTKLINYNHPDDSYFSKPINLNTVKKNIPKYMQKEIDYLKSDWKELKKEIKKDLKVAQTKYDKQEKATKKYRDEDTGEDYFEKSYVIMCSDMGECAVDLIRLEKVLNKMKEFEDDRNT